jgi:hypothetical protein
VNYINAYGCDSVDSEYVVIAKNDTRPRSVDVISGRMYLFLCDSPTSHPYLSSMIFTSFVVLTGFILISLTVAAVSDGVNLRLIEIQKQQQEDEEYERDEELLENLVDAEVPGSGRPIVTEARTQEILTTWKSFARRGEGNQTTREESKTRGANLRRMDSLQEHDEDEKSEEEKSEGDSDCELEAVLNEKKRSLLGQESCPEPRRRYFSRSFPVPDSSQRFRCSVRPREPSERGDTTRKRRPPQRFLREHPTATVTRNRSSARSIDELHVSEKEDFEVRGFAEEEERCEGEAATPRGQGAGAPHARADVERCRERKGEATQFCPP